MRETGARNSSASSSSWERRQMGNSGAHQDRLDSHIKASKAAVRFLRGFTSTRE